MKTLMEWENNYPKIDQIYEGRHLDVYGKRIDIPCDVRSFVYADDAIVKDLLRDVFPGNSMAGLSEQAKVETIQKWIVKNIKYVGDEDQLGSPEFWLFPDETVVVRRGDCEDGSLLMISLCLNAGVDERRLRLTCGYVRTGNKEEWGGHAYMTYCRGDGEVGEAWVPVDWCYLVDLEPIAKRKTVNERPEYGKVWFSFNHRYAWSPVESRLLAGRVKGRKL